MVLKNEVTWYSVPGYFRYQIRYNPESIHPAFREGLDSRGGGKDSILYVTDSNGNLNVFNVEHNDDGLWLNTNYANPDDYWNGDNRWVFRRRKSLHFSLNLVFGEFCLSVGALAKTDFTSCPFQPPSILPISSSGADSAMYFLLSKDFVSHKIISSILSVSNF